MNKKLLDTPPIQIPVIEYGYCHCGCGQKTVIADRNRANRGWIKGEPKKWIAGHETLSPVNCLLDQKTGCWVWQKAKSTGGYGVLLVNGRKMYAHRHYYILANGEFDESLDVCHTCDNPSCVNPNHLFLGTARDNAIDMVRKHRNRCGKVHGTENSNAKLNDSLVKEIRRLFSDGHSIRGLARKFGIANSTMSSIVHGETWRHVK